MIALLCPGLGLPLFAQGVRYQSAVNFPTPTIRVCTEPTSQTPCNTPASIYQDVGLTIPLSNPFTGDTLGNFGFFASVGTYHAQISGTGVTTFDIPYISLTAPFTTTINTVAFSQTPAFSAAANAVDKITLTADVTSSTISGSTAGQQMGFIVCQDGTGGHGFVWPTNFAGPPGVISTAGFCTNGWFVYDGTAWQTLAVNNAANTITGMKVLQFNQSVAATTWTINHNFGVQGVQTFYFDSSWHQIYPDSSTNTSVNTVTATFLQPQAGFATVMDAGQFTATQLNSNAVSQNPTSSQVIAGGFGLTNTGPFTNTGDNPVSLAGSLSAKRIEAVRYADQFPGADIGAQINAAYADLPSRTVTDTYFSPITVHYGTIVIPAGAYSYSTGIVINSPLVNLVGQGLTATFLNYTGSGTAVWFNPNSNVNEFVSQNGPSDFTIDGTGASAGAVGLRTTDFSGARLNVAIRNFTGTGSVGWLDDTINWYNEKMSAVIRFENNFIGWQISPAGSSPGYPNTTFGYGFFDVSIMTRSGQTGLRMINGLLTESLVHLTVNQVDTPANATAIQLQNTAAYYGNAGLVHIESPGGIGSGNEVNIASGATFASGAFDQGLSSSNSGTVFAGPLAYNAPLTRIVVAYTDQQGNTKYQTGFPATGGANQNSPTFNLCGNYWTGSVSASDCWQSFDFMGSGANPQSFLFFSHSGSSSSVTALATPQLMVAPNGPTNANTLIKIPGGQADFPTVFLPDVVNGNLAVNNAAQSWAGNQSNMALVAPTATGMSYPRTNITLANGANVDIALSGTTFAKIIGPSAVFSVSGFAGGVDGRELKLLNSVAFAMTIKNEDAGDATAVNRITTLTGADVTLRAGTSFATFIYDGASSRWILEGTN